MSLLGDLNLELACAKLQLHNHLAARDWRRRILAGGGLDGSIVLLDLVPSRNAKVNAALADKRGDVRSGQEDEGYGEVLDKGDVEAVLAAKLDIGAL